MNSALVKFYEQAEMSESSKRLAIAQIDKTVRLTFMKNIKSVSGLKKLLKTPGAAEKIFGTIESYKSGENPISINTKLTYCNSFATLYQMLAIKDNFIAEKYALLVIERQQTENEKKELKDESGITREQIDQYVAYYADKPLKDRLRVAIITNYPFRLETGTLEHIWLADFESLKAAGQLGIRNFIVSDGEGHLEFNFNGYKTKKKYGNRSIVVENEVVHKLLMEYLASIPDESFLFHTGTRSGSYESGDTEEKIQSKQRNNFTSWVKKSLKKSIDYDGSITDITKVLITEIWSDPNRSPQELQQFAMWRGHQTATAKNIYKKAVGSAE